MADVKWMDFSGAPPILIPERLLPFWNGYYLPEEDPDDDCGDADLTLPDGRKFDACADFDFDDPQTDYDRICARGGGCFLHPVGAGHALVVSDESDGAVGWWPEETTLVTCSRHLPNPTSFDQLDWKDEIRWRIPDRRLLLMNSCLHGADPDKPESDVDEITLEPGEYSITWASGEEEYYVLLYRFRRIGGA